jgi:hypothetical protein
MADRQDPDTRQAGMQEAQINRALGVFMLFFALIILVSIFFTSTTIGKLTNLGAGAIIGLIGGVMFYRAHASAKKQEG